MTLAQALLPNPATYDLSQIARLKMLAEQAAEALSARQLGEDHVRDLSENWLAAFSSQPKPGQSGDRAYWPVIFAAADGARLWNCSWPETDERRFTENVDHLLLLFRNRFPEELSAIPNAHSMVCSDLSQFCRGLATALS